MKRRLVLLAVVMSVAAAGGVRHAAAQREEEKQVQEVARRAFIGLLELRGEDAKPSAAIGKNNILPNAMLIAGEAGRVALIQEADYRALPETSGELTDEQKKALEQSKIEAMSVRIDGRMALVGFTARLAGEDPKKPLKTRLTVILVKPENQWQIASFGLAGTK